MIQESGQENSTTQSEEFSLEETEQALTGKNPHEFRRMQEELGAGEYSTSVRVEGPTVRTYVELAELEPTFLQHQAVTGRPFAASYFNLDKVYKDLDEGQQDVLKKIDEHLMEKVQSGKYTDSAEAVSKIIEEVSKKLHLKDYHDPYYKAERIAKYLDAGKDFDKHKTIKPRLTKAAIAAQKKADRQVKRISKNFESKIEEVKNDKASKQLVKKVGGIEKAMEQLQANDRSTRVVRKLNKIEQELHSIEKPDTKKIEKQLKEIKNTQSKTTTNLESKVAELIEINKKVIAKQAEQRDALAKLLLQ